jgi:hypothetical protein
MQLNLNESDKNYLIKEILNKYLPKQDDLKNIFLMNKTIFGNNFYIQLENQHNNFETRIIYLVDELIDTGKLNNFLKIVREKYSLFANKINIPQLELIQILNDGFEANREIFLKAYQLSMFKRKIVPRESPTTATELISQLTRPNEEQQTHSYIEKFVGYLLEVELNLSPSLKTSLTEWVNKNIKNYKLLELLIQEEQNRRAEYNPCLIVAIKSQLHEYNEYIVNAWLIKNIDQYQNYGSGCQQLNIDNPHTDNNLTGVEGMVRKLIQQCITITNKEPQEIHIFLPLKLMNHPVDCWKMYEDERETIGEKYQIFIRCSEGLIGKNPRVIAWQKKGKLISENLSQTANSIFIMAVDTKVETLEKNLKMANARAAKIIPVFQNNLPGEILWKAAVPLALWVRQELSGIDNRTVLDELINDFDLRELPEQVRLKRLDAMDQDSQENHVGRHLCLLWDDPNLLPPNQNLTDTKL